MRFRLDTEALLKLLEELFLCRVETARVGEVDLGDQIPFATSVNIGNSFPSETLLLAVFGPCFEFECYFSV